MGQTGSNKGTPPASNSVLLLHIVHTTLYVLLSPPSRLHPILLHRLLDVNMDSSIDTASKLPLPYRKTHSIHRLLIHSYVQYTQAPVGPLGFPTKFPYIPEGGQSSQGFLEAPRGSYRFL